MLPPPLTIQIFGPFRTQVHGESLPRVRTRSVEWLLALLTLRHGRAVSRSWLAGMLWPDSEEEQALANLRHDLVSLRKALGRERERLQSPSRDTLMLDLTGAEVDILRFDAAIRAGEEASLHSAVALYTGPLLEGCQEEWAFPERESREQMCLMALETLAESAEQRGDYTEALALLRRAEGMDDLRDFTQRRLMRVLAASGDTPAALLTYRDYRLRLRREMNVEPDEETTRLFQQIRSAGRDKSGSDGERDKRGEAAVREVPLHDAPSRTGEPRNALFSLPDTFPHPLTTLIGREQSVREALALIAVSRLVTLAGTGGIGKTRLAIQTAAEAAETFPAGAVFVALAPLTDPALLPAFVAAALGIREEGASEPESLLKSLQGWLSMHPILLVLDNCEHLIEAVAELTRTLLERCPRLHILATSRQRLGLTGEITWRVPSLPFPDPERLPADEERLLAEVMESPSARLFCERAAMVKPGFRLTGQADAVATAHICQKLDGIPLAIELAATRVGFLTLAQIADRLEDRFRLLTGGSRGALTRHQTLRALIDWSYDLLDVSERALLRRLSVFVGGWTLEAAEALFTQEASQSAADVMERLASLTDKSLVLAEEQNGEYRYRMMETVREYALEKLRQSGEEAAARNRHLTFYLHLAEKFALAWNRPDPEAALSGVESDAGNFRAALTWAHPQASPSNASLRLTAALWPFWEMRGHFSEGRAHFRTALQDSTRAVSPERAQALLGAATLASLQFDGEESFRFAQESLELFRLLADSRGTAAALLCLGNVYLERRDLAAAKRALTEGLEHCRQCGWRAGIATARGYLGRVAYGEGDPAQAQVILEQGLAQAEALGDARLTAQLLHNLAYVVLETGNADHACVLQEKSLAIRRRLGHKPGTAHALNALGRVAQRQGDYTQSLAYHQEAEALYRELGNPAHICNVLYQVGTVCHALGDYPRACSAFEECAELFRRLEHLPHLADVFNHLGSALFHLGDHERARQIYREALAVYRKYDYTGDMVCTMERLAVWEAFCGNAQKAAYLLGTVSVARQKPGFPRARWDQEDWERACASLRAALGEAEFARFREEGSAMSLEQVVAMIVEEPFEATRSAVNPR